MPFIIKGVNSVNIPVKIKITKAELMKWGWAAVQAITDRTEEGLDVFDRKFTEGYSTNLLYVSKKAEPSPSSGGTPSATGKSVRYDGGYREYREAVGLAGDRVTLTAMERMFGSFKPKVVSTKKVTLSFRRTTEKRKASGLNKTRRFVGIAQNTKTMKKFMDKILKRFKAVKQI